MDEGAELPVIHPATDYAIQVVDGAIVAGQSVRWACQRHLDDLELGHERGLYFDEDGADRVLEFAGFIRHFKGEWGRGLGEVFAPSPWQVFILASLFGWKRSEDDLRRFSLGYIEVGKKQGKTFLDAFVGLYMMIGEGEPEPEVWCGATKLEQARILFNAAKSMIRKSPELRGLFGIRKDCIYCEANGAQWKPAGQNEPESFDGCNPSCWLMDEVHALRDSGLWNVLDSATVARRQPLGLATTTAGFEINGFGGQQHRKFTRIIDPNSGIESDSEFVYIASLDDGDDWRDRRVWEKALPGLGVSVSLSTIAARVKRAISDPDEENNVRTKNLNQWVGQAERYFPMADWDACPEALDLEALAGVPCVGGIDLAHTRDLSTLVLIFETESPPYPVLAYSWCPEADIRRRSVRDKVPYTQWRQDGFIEATEGNITDFAYIRTAISGVDGRGERHPGSLMDRFSIREIAYDQRFATQLETQLTGDGVSMVPVAQGFGLNIATKTLKRFVVGHQLVHGGNPVLRWNIDNFAVVRSDSDQVRPSKKKAREKIDLAVALVMAVDRMIRNNSVPTESVYDRRLREGKPLFEEI